MKQLVTDAIVLSRTDFGEADRIITLLTPEYGKLRLMAKGVRRIKSKLAGGIELFSVSRITYIQGRGEVGTLISCRLEVHYDRIVKDIERTMLGYELIKDLHRATEDQPETEYFELLQQAFEALNDPTISILLIRLWFKAQLLRLAGHTPNLTHDARGDKLSDSQKYSFNIEGSGFDANARGQITTQDIKFLRILFNGNQPAVLRKIVGVDDIVARLNSFVQLLSQQYLR